MAVARMETCGTVGELARELGVRPRCLYNWRRKLEMTEPRQDKKRNVAAQHARISCHSLKAVRTTQQSCPGRGGPQVASTLRCTTHPDPLRVLGSKSRSDCLFDLLKIQRDSYPIDDDQTLRDQVLVRDVVRRKTP